MPAAAQHHTLQMATAAPTNMIWQQQLDQLRDAYLVSMLFYYDDLTVRSCILDSVHDEYQALLAPAGIHLLDWTEVGSFQISGTRPFTSPAVA